MKQQGWKRERKRRTKKVRHQRKRANIRAKYGPQGKPGLVTVRRPGQDPRVVDQDSFRPFAPSLDVKAKEAGYENYAAYLDSSAWRSRRREVLNRDGWRCVRCRSRNRLQVHHRFYENLGSESLNALETVCARCHERIHG